MKRLVCSKCGYGWMSRIEKPKECPECKSRKWCAVMPTGSRMASAPSVKGETKLVPFDEV
jgi:primosomal protein N'